MSARRRQTDMKDHLMNGRIVGPLQTREAYLEELRHLIGSGEYDIPAVVIAESMIDHLEHDRDRASP